MFDALKRFVEEVSGAEIPVPPGADAPTRPRRGSLHRRVRERQGIRAVGGACKLNDHFLRLVRRDNSRAESYRPVAA
jgi:hypothetical protein